MFDLDGTLADTMGLHYEAYRRTLAKHGGHLRREDFFRIVGSPAQVTIPFFMEACGLDGPDYDYARRLHSEKKTELERILTDEPLNGLPAIELLVTNAGKKKVAVVTSGNRRGAEAILRSLHIGHLIDVLVSSDDVRNGKPDGEPYAKALSALGSSRKLSLAFEDHEAGIRSALAAGLSVVDVRKLQLIDPNVAAA